MADVRRQRGEAPASCARLQPRQFPAHADDTRADQGLVADEPEGKADQDRRQGNRREECVNMPRKMDTFRRSATVRAPGMAPGVGTAPHYCGKAGKTRTFTPR